MATAMTYDTCLHCGDPVIVYEVGQRYCRPCAQRVKWLEAQDARRADRFARYRVSKDTTGWVPGGAA